MEKVSVSIPCYNIYSNGEKGAEWFRTAVESVLNQTVDDLELLLINDGSTDNTIELLNEYADDSRVTVLSQENRGYPGGRNTGLEAGDGEYYAFISQDDIWEPHMLEGQIAHLQATDDDVVHANANHIDQTGEVTGKRHTTPPPTPTEQDELIRRLFFQNFICIQSSVCHRSAIEGRRFDESFPIMADVDLWMRIADTHSIGYRDEVVVNKRYHDANISSQYEQHFNERKQFVEKFVSRYPFLKPYREQRLSNAHLTYAVAALLDDQAKESKSAARKAIRLYPRNWRAIVAYITALGGSRLGQSVLRRLSRPNHSMTLDRFS